MWHSTTTCDTPGTSIEDQCTSKAMFEYSQGISHVGEARLRHIVLSNMELTETSTTRYYGTSSYTTASQQEAQV